MNVVYVIGVPGAGKTTAVRSAVAELGWVGVEELDPVPHQRYGPVDAAQLGRDRGAFSGTDALSMGINPAAIEFVASRPAALVFGEGDRLANGKFLAAARDHADELVVAWLDVPLTTARERATARSAELGRDPQTETWWKGRATKVANLTAGWADYLVRVTDDPSGRLAELLGTMSGHGE